MIPLFTSIPPHFSRKQASGQDLGAEYARRCIQSWRSSGFDPVTVNSENESLASIVAEENIKCITVKRDAREHFGKPLIFLEDFIASACNYQVDGPVVITNADILIDISDVAYRQLQGLQPGQCFVSKRQDIKEMDSRLGSEYQQGYDFFAFHSSDLKKFKSNDFVMGMPWWDHYFPISMYLMGLEQLSIKDPFVFHLSHSERWDFDKWVILGGKFLKFIERISISNADSLGSACSYVASVGSKIIEPEPGLKNSIKSILKDFKKSGRLEKKIKILYRVADANVKWLDGIRHSR
jgi:hypothetical protein